MNDLTATVNALKNELYALSIAARDPRTPWYAKVLIGLVVGLAVSPIDPIPDVIPVFGLLDDLVFIPAGVYLARRCIPEPAMDAARTEAPDELDRGRSAWLVAAIVVLGWLAVGGVLVHFLL